MQVLTHILLTGRVEKSVGKPGRGLHAVDSGARPAERLHGEHVALTALAARCILHPSACQTGRATGPCIASARLELCQVLKTLRTGSQDQRSEGISS